MPDLTIIIPVHNEAGALPRFDSELQKAIQTLPETPYVVYVDDGSTDGSLEVLQKLGVNHLVSHENLGYGAAIKLAMRRSSTEWIGIIDADLTYTPDDLLRILAAREHCDMVVGQRPREKGMRRLAKGFLQKIASYAVERKIPDINSGLRVFRRDVAMQLLHLIPNGFSLTTTVTMGFMHRGYRVRYLPIAYLERHGESKIRPVKALFQFTLLLLRVMVLWSPLRFFIPVSLVPLFGGLIFLVRDIINDDLAQGSILLLTNAVIIFAIGLLSEAMRSK